MLLYRLQQLTKSEVKSIIFSVGPNEVSKTNKINTRSWINTIFGIVK